MLTTKRLVAGMAALSMMGLSLSGCGLPFTGGSTEVTAYFDDSSGLFRGNDVGVLGVNVGKVKSIEPQGDRVKVVFEITDEDVDIPADVGAVVVSRSVATDRYIELTPVYKGGDKLQNGAEIPLERTKTPVEWDEILAALDKFTNGLSGPGGDAGALRRLLKVGARSLDGTGAKFNQTLTDVARAAEALSSHRGDLTGSIDNLAALTEVLAANKAIIDDFATSITDATDLFADEREQFGSSLRALSTALNSLGTFIKANRGQLKTALVGLTDVTDNLLKHQAELAEAIETVPVAFENIGLAVRDNGTINVRIPLQDLSPIPDVTSALCSALPAGLCNTLGLSPDLGELLDVLTGGLG